MKILVTGVAGLLGTDVWKVFERTHELIALGRTQPAFVPPAQWRDCALADAAQTYAVVTKENPDLVIHCAAYNRVDQAESEPEEAYRGNAQTNRNLALACQRFDTVLMSISSDYVFNGVNAPPSGYREFDPTSPAGRYGESKRWGEIAVQELLNKYFIVRTSWLFGPSRATWVDAVATQARDGKPVSAVLDMVSSPTYTPDLAEALLALAESKLFGLYHLTSSGFCSRVELAEEVLRLNRLSPYANLRRLTQAEIKLPAPRPSFSVLDNLAWRVGGFKALRSWKEALNHHVHSSKVVS